MRFASEVLNLGIPVPPSPTKDAPDQWHVFESFFKGVPIPVYWMHPSLSELMTPLLTSSLVHIPTQAPITDP